MNTSNCARIIWNMWDIVLRDHRHRWLYMFVRNLNINRKINRKLELFICTENTIFKWLVIRPIRVDWNLNFYEHTIEDIDFKQRFVHSLNILKKYAILWISDYHILLMSFNIHLAHLKMICSIYLKCYVLHWNNFISWTKLLRTFFSLYLFIHNIISLYYWNSN